MLIKTICKILCVLRYSFIEWKELSNTEPENYKYRTFLSENIPISKNSYSLTAEQLHNT